MTKPLSGQPAGPVPAAPESSTSWRFGRLLSAPHRLGFMAGALMLALSALWWAAVLALRQFAPGLAWAVPPSLGHGLLMALGFTPFFIVGFLFTAGPRWLGQPEVAARNLLVPVLALLAGWMLVLPGLTLAAGLAAAGMALVALGWAALCLHFSRLLLTSRATDRLHASLVALAAWVGVLAMALAAAALLRGDTTLLRAATQLALWGFVAPVFAAVSHRMIPFFSASALPFLDAWRPTWLLWTLMAVLWLEAAFALAELWWWPLPAALRWAQVAFEAPAAALLLWLALRWGLVQSLRIRLLAMLHGGFVWLGLALALAALSHALMAATGGAMSLGLAPLHAMTMGYLGATLFAMATRVSAGHSGRPLAADNPAWALYWVLQTAVLLRVVAAVWPAASTVLTWAALLAWAMAVVGWALRYGSWFGRPRADGRPG
ncbi:MAG: NnrS family protein [Rubrivivax sp.]|nr:NnrS family protein [Rubrivivax sp.]